MVNYNKPKVLIIGLGLLGASLGMALRNCNYQRLGWTRKKDVREWAVENNVVEKSSDSVEELLQEADIIILATPIPQIVEYLKNYCPYCKENTIVTDIGSVKSSMLEYGEKLSHSNIWYVGSHPMAGTEKSGAFAAFPELYNKASVFICPNEFTPEYVNSTIEELWKSINTKVSFISVSEHDKLVARTSHSLHIIATALTLDILGVAGEENIKNHFDGCATGFKDTSRIASSSPSMWRNIIEHNQSAVLEALDDFEENFAMVRKLIENKEFEKFESEFNRGRILREKWLKYKGFIK